MAVRKIIPLLLGKMTGAPWSLDYFWHCYPGNDIHVASILAFLIMTDDGPVLVDTGFRPEKRDKPLMAFGKEIIITDEMQLENQLKNNGVSADDIRTVIITHLHNDHIGGAGLLKNAKFFIQRKEIEAAAAPLTCHMDMNGFNMHYNRKDVAMVMDEIWPRVEVIEGETEIAAGIKCVPFYNTHTPGSQAVYVSVDNMTAAIAGDVARNTEANIVKQIPPAIFYNLEDTQKALWKLKNDADRFYLTHEYKVWEDYQKENSGK